MVQLLASRVELGSTLVDTVCSSRSDPSCKLRACGSSAPERSSPPTAQPFRAHSRAEEHAFHYFFDISVIRETTPGRYYLDERSLELLRRRLLVPWWR